MSLDNCGVGNDVHSYFIIFFQDEKAQLFESYIWVFMVRPSAAFVYSSKEVRSLTISCSLYYNDTLFYRFGILKA